MGIRSSEHGLQQAGIVAAIVALTLAGGEAPDEALGVATVLVWILVIVATLAPAGAADRFARMGGRHLLATLLLGGMLALTVASLAWGSDDGAGFREVVLLAGYLGVFTLAGLTLGPGRGRSLCVAVALAVVAIALLALASRLLGLGGGDAALADLLPPASGRLSYPVGYWNALGALMALAVPVLISLAARSGEPIRAGLWVAAAAPAVLVAYMTSSRGALLAALLGAGIVIWMTRERARALAALALAAAAAMPAIVAATLADDLLTAPGADAPGGAEIVVLAALLIGAAATVRLGGSVLERAAALRPPARLPSRPVAAGLLAALVAGLVVLAGPGRLVEGFNTLPEGPRADPATGILSASGSGRAQFWETALEAFAQAPLNGVGAGGFGSYWNRNGSLGTPTRNVHSEPIELLAEVGLLGFLCFSGFVVVIAGAGVRRGRGSAGGEDVGMALGLLAAGSVGFAIDWTWQVPAVTAPVLAVAAALAASAFLPARSASALASAAAARVPAVPVAATALTLLAIGSIWAGGVLGIAAAKLSESERALAAGDASDAARAAREAAAVEPWAAEPWLQLAQVESTVDNFAAARRATREAVERAPEDFRGWFLASVTEGELGNEPASINYALRAAQLAPLVLQRLPEFVPALGSRGA